MPMAAGWCPRVHPGPGPGLAARCPPGRRVRAGLYRESRGAQRDRPQLQAALDYMRPDDTLVVWKLDRLARSLRQLLDTVEVLHARQIGLRSLTEAIDTSTPCGDAGLSSLGALAEFERSIIRERTRAGLAAARARGRTGGFAPALSCSGQTGRPGAAERPGHHGRGGRATLAGLAGHAYRHLPGAGAASMRRWAEAWLTPARTAQTARLRLPQCLYRPKRRSRGAHDFGGCFANVVLSLPPFLLSWHN